MNKREFINGLEQWVSDNIDKDLIRFRKDKVIREPVHGLNKFSGWEINFVDLPIIQRLRNISQNGLAYFTYPGAIQNRFDHTLGVVVLTERFIDSIGIPFLNKELKYNLRLAAIFHDVGHGLFSHLSEEIYKNLKPIDRILKEPKFRAAAQVPKPHEIISYYIVKSNALEPLYNKSDRIFRDKFDGTINPDFIAECIIGNVSNQKFKFCQDIINGSFDADKLDYIQRDCYFTGLKMAVDVERIFQNTLYRVSKDNTKYELVIDSSGVHNLEHLLFSKLLLFPSLYHHHKVRACACMFKTIFEIMHDHDLEINGKKFDNPLDFLESTDDIFLSYKDKPKLIQEPIKNLLNRALLKKALVISHDVLKGDKFTIDTQYKNLIKWQGDLKKIKYLRKLIADEIDEVTEYDIWVDLPDPPSLREASQCIIKVSEEGYDTLDSFFPQSGWLTTYQEHKWRGFIFCPPKKTIREEVHKVSRRILLDMGIDLTDGCYHQAKIRYEF